jgi:rubrerythrin
MRSFSKTVHPDDFSETIMSKDDSRQNLIRILQVAYSAELAAAYAYRGHWHSVSDKAERARIEQIENEEWHHRELVGEMLAKLESAPQRSREIRAKVIGRALGLLCHVSGWLAPMYGAGRLESTNIVEYEIAAGHARDCSREDFIDCLLTMAEVEWEHEQYFRSRVLLHPIGKRLPIWPEPRPKKLIRESFAQQIERDPRSATADRVVVV